MKIALVTGPFPRGECGVGDYVVLLAEALNARGIQTHIIDSGNWKLLNSLELHRGLRRQEFDLVQIHYPSLGFGTNLGPQAVALLRKCVVTLHEASQSHLLRKLALFPFSLRPHHVIFFSNFERNFGLRWAPWISGISSVIAPPSNIRKFAYDGPRDLSEIVFFGLIRPGNGHESLIEFAMLLKASGLPLRIRAIGSPQSAKFAPYFEDLRKRAEGLPIIWDHGLSEEQIGERLARSCLAYLPYPGGAAELRSTLKAALLNGLAVITRRGTQTPSNLEGVVKFCDSPHEALETARFLLGSPEERAILARRATEYVHEWTWERTAELHEGIYRGVLRANSPEGATVLDRVRTDTHSSSEPH
jgi:glycosyltransferase involved in cell wall biosynthesis